MSGAKQWLGKERGYGRPTSDGELKGFQGILWEKEMKAKYIVVEESYKKNPSQMLDRR